MDKFMQAAIEQAQKGRNEGGIPIGSVLIKDDQIISAGHNQRVQQSNPILHAEIDCIQNAGRIGSYKAPPSIQPSCLAFSVQAQSFNLASKKSS